MSKKNSFNPFNLNNNNPLHRVVANNNDHQQLSNHAIKHKIETKPATRVLNGASLLMKKAKQVHGKDEAQLKKLETRKLKAVKEAKDEEKNKKLKSEQYVTNKANKELERKIKSDDVASEHSTQTIAPHWLAPPWLHGNCTDKPLSLMLVDLDIKDVRASLCPKTMIQTHLLSKNKQKRTNPHPKRTTNTNQNKEAFQKNNQDIEDDVGYQKKMQEYKKGPNEYSVNVPVVRVLALADNGSSVQVRIHGFRPHFYIPLPDPISKCILESCFPDLLQDKDYIWHKGTRIPLRDTLNSLKDRSDLNEQKEACQKITKEKEMILNNNPLMIQYCTWVQNALESELQIKGAKNLAWQTGDYTHAMVISVLPKLRRDMYGYDFDEQILFLDITVSLTTVQRMCKEILMNGLTLSNGIRIILREEEFYNFNLSLDMLFLIENHLSGMTWFTLPENSYEIITGKLIEEQRNIEKEKNILNQTKKKKEKIKTRMKKIAVEDDEDNDEEMNDLLAANTKELNEEELANLEEENEKKRQTWMRAEIDVHYHHLISHYRSTEVKWEKLANYRTFAWDIECSAREGHFPKPEQDSVICISVVLKGVHDVEKRQKLVLTYEIVRRPGIHDDNDPNQLDLGPDVDVWVLKDEVDLLRCFADLLRACQPTEITGFNILKFDWKYVLDRARVLGIKTFPLLTPYKECVTAVSSLFQSAAAGQQIRVDVTVSGSIVADLYRWAVSELKLGSNTLNAVADKVMNKSKLDLHYSLITPFFNGTKDDRTKLLLYNLIDSDLCIDIKEHPKQQILLRKTEIARVTGVTITMLETKGQGVKTESQLHRLMLEHGYLTPNRRRIIKGGGPRFSNDKNDENNEADEYDFDEMLNEEQEGFTGATCVKPKIGFYKQPIATLDYASLYPSIMIAYNFSYDTFIMSIETQARLGEGNYEIVKDENNPDNSDLIFVKRHIRRGLLCQLVDYLLIQRRVVKKSIAEAEDLGKSTDLLEARSLALKLAANSTYGFAAAFKIYMKQISEAVCRIGRQSLQITIETIEKEFCIQNGYDHNAKIIYGDSVSGDTPILIRTQDKMINITCIEALSYHQDNANWQEYKAFKPRDMDRTDKQQCVLDNIETWTTTGWKKIKRVIKHKVNKQMFRILTHTGCVDVTEDHSLLLLDKEPVKPRDVEIGLELYHHFPSKLNSFFGNSESCMLSIEEAFVWGLFMSKGICSTYVQGNYWYWNITSKNNQLLRKCKLILDAIEPQYQFTITQTKSHLYHLKATCLIDQLITKYRTLFFYEHNDQEGKKPAYKRVPSFILNASLEMKKYFLKGYLGDTNSNRFHCQGKLGSQGLFYLVKSLGYSASIHVNDSYSDYYQVHMIKLNSFRKQPRAIKEIILLPDNDHFVYDLETEDGTFQAGIGEMIVKNTDSVMILFGVDSVEECNVLAKKARDLCNKAFNDRKPMKLDFEKVYFPFLLLRAKNYAAMKYDPDRWEGVMIPDEKTGILKPYKAKKDTKGLENKRRDKIKFTQQVVDKGLDYILSFTPIKKILEWVYKRNEALCKSELPMSQIIQSKSIKASYTTQTQQSVIADNIRRRDPTLAPEAGDRASFVYVKTIGKNSKACDQVEEPLSALKRNLPIDYEKIGTSLVINAEKRILRQLIPYNGKSDHLNKDQLTAQCKKLGASDKELEVIGEDITLMRQYISADEELAWVFQPFFTVYPTLDIPQGGGLIQYTKIQHSCLYTGCGIKLESTSTKRKMIETNQDKSKKIKIEMIKDDQDDKKEKVEENTDLVLNQGKINGKHVLCNIHRDFYEQLEKEYLEKIQKLEKESIRIWKGCRECVGEKADPKDCSNVDCNLEFFWLRRKVDMDLNQCRQLLARIRW